MTLKKTIQARIVRVCHITLGYITKLGRFIVQRLFSRIAHICHIALSHITKLGRIVVQRLVSILRRRLVFVVLLVMTGWLGQWSHIASWILAVIGWGTGSICYPIPTISQWGPELLYGLSWKVARVEIPIPEISHPVTLWDRLESTMRLSEILARSAPIYGYGLMLAELFSFLFCLLPILKGEFLKYLKEEA